MDNLQVTIDFLNVGFGECTIIKLHKENKVIVIDGGDDIKRYKKEQLGLKEYLINHNINCIDLLIITHPHPDHIVGIISVLEDFVVDKVAYSIDIPKTYYGKIIKYNHEAARGINSFNLLFQTFYKNKVEVIKVIEEKEFTFGEVKLILYPPSQKNIGKIEELLLKLYLEKDILKKKELLEIIDKNLNKTSMAIIGELFGRRVLFTSELRDVELDEIISTKQKYKVDLIHAPHHGDKEYISYDFLKLYNPNFIIISADDEGTYGLPSPDFSIYVKEILTNVKILRTYMDEMKRKHRGIRMELFEEKEMKNTSLKYIN